MFDPLHLRLLFKPMFEIILVSLINLTSFKDMCSTQIKALVKMEGLSEPKHDLEKRLKKTFKARIKN